MIFGQAITTPMVIAGGLTLFALLLFQVLVGLRIIKFGRKTNLYHRYIAFTIIGVAVIHGTLAILFVTGAKLF